MLDFNKKFEKGVSWKQLSRAFQEEKDGQSKNNSKIWWPWGFKEIILVPSQSGKPGSPLFSRELFCQKESQLACHNMWWLNAPKHARSLKSTLAEADCGDSAAPRSRFSSALSDVAIEDKGQEKISGKAELWSQKLFIYSRMFFPEEHRAARWAIQAVDPTVRAGSL